MHSVVFENACNSRNEALPMGNGVFGGMVFYDGQSYTTVMNHYEVYYSIYQEERLHPLPSKTYESYRKAAEERKEDYEREAFWHYRKTIWPEADKVKEASFSVGTSHPPTGEFSVLLEDGAAFGDDFKLQLDIEKAEIGMEARGKGRRLTIETRTLISEDVIDTVITQSDEKNVTGLEIVYPQRRNHKGYQYHFFQMDEKDFGYEVTVPDSRLQFCVLFRLIGARAKMEAEDNQMRLLFQDAKKEVHILTHVLTSLQSTDRLTDGKKNLDITEKNLKQERNLHQKHWNAFFRKGSIQIPDRFLEKLWYLNLYVLGCCSGKGGKRYEHACGLNGLWDTCQPTMWGSMWYWDVNIQSAFWGAYTANHMELAEAFCDGLLYYAEPARRRAEKFYHLPGYAIDFPHEFYNCILPWCAEHLWWYYEYTLDEAFLREKAYPFFQKLLYFVKGIVQTDPEKGTCYIFPDVSPEQGPVTRNSTITLATVKYLLKFAIRANEILGESEEDRKMFSELLEKWPDYPAAETDRYGKILKDSELAPPLMELRHPSLLMPVFPIGEMTQFSGETERELAKNTVRFATEHTEIGVFPFGWIASAAARTGEGNTALRVLYEQGLDLILRANGMGAEETERWMNHCPAEHGRGQLYYPCMMECVGGIVSVVNEMLLQSYDGIIHLFPALPDGNAEQWREKYRQRPLVIREERKAPKWEDCAFFNLLAKGGFEVSAKLRKGKVVFLRIKSLYGKTLRLEAPEGLLGVMGEEGRQEFSMEENGCLCMKTREGETYEFLLKNKESHEDAPLQSYHTGISYVSHLGRRVFCGKNQYTDTIQRIDSFLFDDYMANQRRHHVPMYRFSFGVPKEQLKPLKGPLFYEPQLMVEKEFLKVTEKLQYCSSTGIGFVGKAMKASDTGRGNVLMQDYLSGREKDVFQMELPAGIYEFLVVCGGGDEQTLTKITCPDGNATTIRAKKARYETGIFLAVHKRNGILSLKIDTGEGLCWNLNLMIVKKLTALS